MAAHWGLGWRGASWERRRLRLRRWQAACAEQAGGRLWNRLLGCHANRKGLRELGKTRRPHNRCARPLGRARARRLGGWVEGAGARTEYAECLARRRGGGRGADAGRRLGLAAAEPRGWVRTPSSLLAPGIIAFSCLPCPIVTYKREERELLNRTPMRREKRTSTGIASSAVQ